jgi:TorA maturation chaperone TorD
LTTGLSPETGVADEERLRSQVWHLLGRLLQAPPDADLLRALAAIESNESPLGRAFHELAEAARRSDAAATAEEYHALFIGLTRGELVPYGSYYATGFLHELPLARLRGDMARLGIAPSPGVGDPEDHIAALCEMMAGLIDGVFAPCSLAEQERFFAAHIGGWASRFFADLEAAPAARLYRPVGTLGRLFIEIERSGFAMAA